MNITRRRRRGRRADAVQHKVREKIKYGADLIKVCATGGVLSQGDNPQAPQFTSKK